MVDNQCPARRKLNHTGIGGLDLVFNLKPRIKRNVVTVALHPWRKVGHDMQHELTCLLVYVIGIDENFANVGMEVVANGANDQARLLVNEVGARLKGAGIVYCLPELQKVVEVPLQFVDRATNTGSSGDHAHTVGQNQLVHGVFQLLPVFALNTARNASSTRVIRHEY